MGERDTTDKGSPGLQMLVVNDRGVFQVVLPAAGELTVGRGSECGLPLGDRNLSRRHAALRIGARLEVVDLGSLNGTRVGGRSLRPNESVVVRSDDAILIASTILVIQRAPSSGPPSHPPPAESERPADSLGPMRARAATLPATDEVPAVSLSPLSASDDDATWLRRIVESLRSHSGDQAAAAASLGIAQSTLVERLAAMAQPFP